MEPSDAVTARIRERAAGLERLADRITSCHVVIEPAHKRHHQGNLFQVRLQVRAPGHQEIVINREGPLDHAHEDAYVAIRDAFDALERQLEDAARKRDHRAKRHEVPPHGKVVRLFPEDGYGFLETSDGLDVYFHEHSVVDAKFRDLVIGEEVRVELAPEPGKNGPHASSVRPIGKHHLTG
jgi:ribosomal subunit interface protein